MIKHYHSDYYKSIAGLSESEQIEAIRDNIQCLKYIPEPSELVQIAAIKKSPGAIFYIKHPTRTVLALAAVLSPWMSHFPAFKNIVPAESLKDES